MPRPRVAVTAVLALAVSAGWRVLAACPVGPENACAIDLRGAERPGVSANCSAEPWKDYLSFEQPNGVSDADGDHWWETVLELDLDPARGCRCANFTVRYGDDPAGWTVNVGDSPTNNGHGGDDGDTPWAAEVQVSIPPGRGGEFRAYSADLGGGADTLLTQMLPGLEGGTLKLRICDQEFQAEWISADPEAAPLGWGMQTFNSQILFALAGQAHPLRPGRQEDDRLYAGFNRVIHHRNGPADKERIGRGVRRVEIALTP